MNTEDILEISSSKYMEKIKEILIIGAGTSTCVPNISCLAIENPTCKVCMECVGMYHRSKEQFETDGGPLPGSASRNIRTNPSAAIRYSHSDGTMHSIIIDCGKSFYGNALKSILKAGIRKVDGFVITHGHADAILGLDDLRHWAGHHPSIQPFVDVYCDQNTFTVICETFPYLVDPQCATGGGEVSRLRFHRFEMESEFEVGELTFKSVKLEHGTFSDGKPYYSNGFLVEGLAYFSDASHIDPTEFIGGRVDILVVDCLSEFGSYKSHLCWPQSKEIIEAIKPNCASLLVGMSHKIDYYAFQKKLQSNIYVGFDGMLLKL